MSKETQAIFTIHASPEAVERVVERLKEAIENVDDFEPVTNTNIVEHKVKVVITPNSVTVDGEEIKKDKVVGGNWFENGTLPKPKGIKEGKDGTRIFLD